MYEIKSKSDFQTGATLIVKIPEKDLDKKAFYTILADKPSFLLPSRHRVIDGEIELIYQIGNRSRIMYLSGNRSPDEYVDLWLELLNPLLDCGDWFMTPYSFVLKSEYLFCDKISKSINFIYIPSVQACSDYNTLKTMVTEIAKQNHVTDMNFENKAIWAIQEFNPDCFLQMLKSYKPQIAQEKPLQHESISAYEFIQKKEKATTSSVPVMPANAEIKSNTPNVSGGPIKKSDDIVINFFGNEKPEKKKKTRGGIFGFKKEKKKEPPQEIVQGAAAILPEVKPVSAQQAEQAYIPIQDAEDYVTELDINETDGAKLRYIGNGSHPRIIDVNIKTGEFFTIGRFDASIGSKQSDFEFDKKTKAVSRRHCVIERSEESYSIVDLSSSAGTFLNKEKLLPNMSFKLESGCSVSFGHAGADYIWEE